MKSLKHSIDLKVRFSETDAMGVVWHGNYLKFFEDAREAFGAKYGMEYLDFFNNGYFTPIVKSEIQHKNSVYFGEDVRVNIVLEQHEAAKLIFKYEVINLAKNNCAAVGSTMQVFLSVEEREMELTKPDFYKNWEEQQTWV
jgi:acyl-CoA thioester hydrolase